MSFISRAFWRSSPSPSSSTGGQETSRSDKNACPLTVTSSTATTQVLCDNVRTLLLCEFATNSDLYELSDIDLFVHSGNGYISRYLERRKSNVTRTFEMMRDTLRFRKSFEVSTFDDTSFPIEFYAIGGLFQYGHDLEGKPMLVMRCKIYHNIPELKEGMEKFIVYNMYKTDARGMAISSEDKGWTFLFDVSGMAFPQYDVQELIWLINTLLNYFPSGLKKVLVYNVPFILRPFVLFMLTFVPKEWKHVVTCLSGEAIFSHIARDQVPAFIAGGTCTDDYRRVPEGARPVEVMAAERYGMSRDQCDKIRVHFDKYFDS